MNAFQILAERGYSNPNLSAKADGGPVNAQEYAAAAGRVVGGDDPLQKKIEFSYFQGDVVSVLFGGNPGVLTLKEFWSLITTNNSLHSCYGTGAAGCRQVQYLSPNGPPGAVQDNSTLIQFRNNRYEIGGSNPVELGK
jgi:filamentous hemagglutinin